MILIVGTILHSATVVAKQPAGKVGQAGKLGKAAKELKTTKSSSRTAVSAGQEEVRRSINQNAPNT